MPVSGCLGLGLGSLTEPNPPPCTPPPQFLRDSISHGCQGDIPTPGQSNRAYSPRSFQLSGNPRTTDSETKKTESKNRPENPRPGASSAKSGRPTRSPAAAARQHKGAPRCLGAPETKKVRGKPVEQSGTHFVALGCCFLFYMSILQPFIEPPLVALPKARLL